MSGLNGALFSGVSGLQAEAQTLGIISDNISNSNTVGYKASVEQFQTLVTQPATATKYSPGGVLTSPRELITQQGLLTASQSSSDVGIQGQGFFIVSNQLDGTSVAAGANITYTRAGSFIIDKAGNLINTAGQYLLGVPTDTSGKPLQAAASTATLKPVNIGTLTGIASGTTKLSLSANLPATPSLNTPLKFSGVAKGNVGGATIVDTGPAGNGYVVYSSNGSAYAIKQINLVPDLVTAGVYSVQIPSAAGNITPLNGAPALNVPIPAVYNLGTATVDVSGAGKPTTFAGSSNISFADGSTYSPTLDFSGLKFGAANALNNTAVDAQDVTAVVYDSLGVAHNLTLEFSRYTSDPAVAGGPPTTNSPNEWTLTIQNMTIAQTGQTSIKFPLPAPGSAAGFPIYLNGKQALNGQDPAADQSVITFNPDGTIKAGAPNGLPGLPMITGASPFGGSSFSLNLGTANTNSGLTQYTGKFALGLVDQNGVPFGFRTGVSFTTDGHVNAVFSNGQTVPLFQLPLASFANADGLSGQTGDIFQQTILSGDPILNYPGDGQKGTVSPSTLESSTVDLSTEFTNMIITQRSYQANARTITTADQMLQELLAIQ